MYQNRKNNISKWLILSILVISISSIAAACSAPVTPEPLPPATEMPMESEGMEMDMSGVPAVPAGIAYADGEEIRFIHTEVSDPDIAKVLSDMMNSPVLVVPSLAKASEEMLAKVYVFKNGQKGMGPLGYQPDVFDNPPGSPDYSPLRKIVLVSWLDEGKARELKSVAEVTEAEKNGEITLEETGVVVNMPFITWIGGQR